MKEIKPSTSGIPSTYWILEIPRATFSISIDGKDQSIGLKDPNTKILVI